MSPIKAVDLAEAAAAAVALSTRAGQRPVVAGALALAAHGYRRETSDVDIVVPVVIGAEDGDALEVIAKEMGLTVRAKHGFGGLDLRAGDVRIDVLTLDRDLPTLVPEAVTEAVASERRTNFFGQDFYVISIGHLIAMKLVAERKKDVADIVELIKARMQLGEWKNERQHAHQVVKAHLGWYAARAVDNLSAAAKAELREEQ